MPVLREQRRREFASHYWGPTTFFSKNAGRWTESGALERERRSWTSDRSSSPPAGGGAGDRDDRPVAELHLGLEARSPSAAGVKSTSAYSPGRAYGASSTFGNVVSLADVSVASRSTMASSSSFGYEPARFGFVDEPRSSSSSARGFSFGGGEARELNFVSKPAQQQQQHHGHHQQQHRQQQAGRSSPGPFAEATAFGSETDPGERDSDLEIGVLRSDWRAASGGSSGVGARQPGAASTSTAQQQQQQPVGAVAVPGGGGSAGGGGGDAQSPPMSSGAPCGACKFLRRKCVRGCIFAPYFGAEQGAARFAAVHKIFGASNVSKLLLHIPLPKRCDAVLTISYEAQARISDPVYGCVATIFALQQQVASLQAELAMVQSQLTSRLAAAALQQQQQQHQHVQQQQHHQTATSAYDTSSISMSIPSPNQNVTGGAGPGSAGPYGGSSSRVKEEASFHTFHYDVGMGGSSMSIDSAANQHQHLLHLDTYNASAQKAAATRHLLGDHSRTGEADMGELQALAHALLRRK